MRGAILPLPNTSSWCSAKLRTGYVFIVWYLVKHKDNFTFYLTFSPVLTLKGKVFSVLHKVPRHEDVWGSGSICPRILNLANRCE
jgi:hypothetical protein